MKDLIKLVISYKVFKIIIGWVLLIPVCYLVYKLNFFEILTKTFKYFGIN